jgi:hypothetical protein
LDHLPDDPKILRETEEEREQMTMKESNLGQASTEQGEPEDYWAGVTVLGEFGSLVSSSNLRSSHRNQHGVSLGAAGLPLILSIQKLAPKTSALYCPCGEKSGG